MPLNLPKHALSPAHVASATDVAFVYLPRFDAQRLLTVWQTKVFGLLVPAGTRLWGWKWISSPEFATPNVILDAHILSVFPQRCSVISVTISCRICCVSVLSAWSKETP